MLEWEFHTPPEGNFDIDLDGAMRATRDAGAEGILLYTQCCWGHAYYPTNIGLRHPNLHFDLFGKEVELAHKLGLSVTAYYCVQLGNETVFHHPDWAWINAEGKQEKFRWYFTCMDTPYRRQVLGMIDEIFSRYQVEELFLDAFGMQVAFYRGPNWDPWKPFCFCKHTEAAWDKEHPGDPYRPGFETREGWQARWEWHQRRDLLDLLDEINAIVHRHQPNVVISLNGGPEVYSHRVLEKIGYLYNEPVTTPTGIALGPIMTRGWGRPDYQAGVFSEFGYLDTYPGSIPRVQAASLLAQNARTFFVGNAAVVGGLDGHGYSQRWFDVAKENWTDARSVDCLLPGLEPLYSSAVLFSEATREEIDLQKRPILFRSSTFGALELATYSGRPVESIPEFRLSPGLLGRFDMLVLPETEVLATQHAGLVRDWVRNGGTLIASYNCGLRDERGRERTDFALADVLGVHFAGEEKKYAYDSEGKLKPNFLSTYLESAGHRLAKPLPPGTVALPGPFMHLEPDSAEEVMHYRLPVMVEDLSTNKWFNWGPPPPANGSAGLAVAYNRFGKGQAVYIGAPAFRAMSAQKSIYDPGVPDRPFWIRAWVPELIRQLVPNPVAEIVPEPFTEYFHGTFFYDRSRDLVLVQAVNTVELMSKGELQAPVDAVIRVNPAKLKLRGARMVWPQTRDLPVQQEGRRKVIRLPQVERYAAVYLALDSSPRF
jgi:hypothetical protein